MIIEMGVWRRTSNNFWLVDCKKSLQISGFFGAFDVTFQRLYKKGFFSIHTFIFSAFMVNIYAHVYLLNHWFVFPFLQKNVFFSWQFHGWIYQGEVSVHFELN